jgi:hypothetical protein
MLKGSKWISWDSLRLDYCCCHQVIRRLERHPSRNLRLIPHIPSASVPIQAKNCRRQRKLQR